MGGGAQVKTLSQSVQALAEEMGYGKTFGWPAYQLAARDWLIRDGAKPSPAMVRTLAIGVQQAHAEDDAACKAGDL